MYFHALVRVGLVGLLVAASWTHHEGLLWVMAALWLLHRLQRAAPHRCTATMVTPVFMFAIVAQTMLDVGVAWMTAYVGAILIATGDAMNILVVSANGCRMPTPHEGIDDPCYSSADEHTRLALLSDIFPTTDTPTQEWVISAGDALVCIGIWVLAAELLLP